MTDLRRPTTYSLPEDFRLAVAELARANGTSASNCIEALAVAGYRELTGTPMPRRELQWNAAPVAAAQ